MKKIISIVLLLFVGASLVYLIAGETSSKPETAGDAIAAADTAGTVPGTGQRFVAFYFHSTARCVSCRKIEKYSDEAITGSFGNNIADGNLIWTAVNIDEDPNSHFIDDFELYTKSLIIAEYIDTTRVRWKNLDRVWELLNDREAFIAYVQDEITAFMKEG